MLGDASSAVADFRRARDLGRRHAFLYLFLTQWPIDPDGAVSELREHAASLTDGAWPQPVMAHLLGELSLDGLTVLAADAGELCEAKFYAGSWLLLHDQPVQARLQFHEAMAVCPHDFIEYVDAGEALERLGETEPF
jgi:lipoprotein NlpI